MRYDPSARNPDALLLFLQDLCVARSFPPIEDPEDEDTENLGGNESGGEVSVGNKAGDGENIDEFVVEQHVHNADTSSDAESSPAADHDDRADDVLTGGFVDEDSMFDE